MSAAGTSSPGNSKRRKTKGPRATIERIIGGNVAHNGAFSCHKESGEIAYPAGAVIVHYSPSRNKQIRFYQNSTNTAFTCVAFSPNGKFIAAGESGAEPAVVIWETATGQRVAMLKGHRYPLQSIVWSPNMKHVASLGQVSDGTLLVWDWKAPAAILQTKISGKIFAMSFAEHGRYLVTAGAQHIKYWNVVSSPTDKSSAARKDQVGNATGLMGRPGILADLKDYSFVDVACGVGENQDSVFTVTSTGVLCQLNTKRMMDKWVDLKTTGSFALDVTETHIACACADGVVRLFNPTTLEYMATLPRPHPLGPSANLRVDASYPSAPKANLQYPDAMAIRVAGEDGKVSVWYSDHSLFVWDIKNMRSIGKYRSFLAHAGCIWDLETAPNSGALPPGTFITGSSDATIRFWNLDPQSIGFDSTDGRHNMYSRDIRHMIFVDDEYPLMKAARNEDGSLADPTATLSPSVGVRCLRISPDGTALASGDRAGNLRLFDLQSMTERANIDAHDAEILGLDYSLPTGAARRGNDHLLLATCSRDRLIHVLDVDRGNELVHTLDDHAASITAVRFASGGDRLVSCSADRQLVFRSLLRGPDGMDFRTDHSVSVPHGAVYDMDVDVTSRYIVAVGQDKMLNIFHLGSGKVIRSYKTECDGLRVSLDPSGIYAASSSGADKFIRIYDFFSGERLAELSGHAEAVTAVRFTPDCQRLLSVSGDGCIFVWRLDQEIVGAMHDRMSEIAASAATGTPARGPRGEVLPSPSPSPMIERQGVSTPKQDAYAQQRQSLHEMLDQSLGRNASPSNPAASPYMQLRPSALPAWAKAGDEAGPISAAGRGGAVRGRWAERINNEVPLFSEVDSEDTAPRLRFDPHDKRRYTIEVGRSADQDGEEMAAFSRRRLHDPNEPLPMPGQPPAPLVFPPTTPIAAWEQPMPLRADSASPPRAEEDQTLYGAPEEEITQPDFHVVPSRGKEEAVPAQQGSPVAEEDVEVEVMNDEAAQDAAMGFASQQPIPFVEKNFESLAQAWDDNNPRRNPMRMSISKHFMEQMKSSPVKASTPVEPPTTSASPRQSRDFDRFDPVRTSFERDTTKAAEQGRLKVHREKVAEEVKRMRERLARLGMLVDARRTSREKEPTLAAVPEVSTPPSAPALAAGPAPQVPPEITTTATRDDDALVISGSSEEDEDYDDPDSPNASPARNPIPAVLAAPRSAAAASPRPAFSPRQTAASILRQSPLLDLNVEPARHSPAALLSPGQMPSPKVSASPRVVRESTRNHPLYNSVDRHPLHGRSPRVSATRDSHDSADEFEREDEEHGAAAPFESASPRPVAVDRSSLAHPLNAYRDAITHLRESFRNCVVKFNEVKTVHTSMSVNGAPPSGMLNGLVHSFEDVFAEMKASLPLAQPEEELNETGGNLTSSTIMTDASVRATLERYSEMLVGMVASKLQTPRDRDRA